MLESKNLASEIGNLLKAMSLTVAVAEACTAGLLGYMLTTVSGSSAYFYGGFIVYASSMKRRLLHVPQGLLDSRGSVHRLTALSMAKNVMELSDTDIGISVTGVAGPTGGTSQRPVGLFYVAVVDTNGYEGCQEYRFGNNDRDTNRYAAVRSALGLLSDYLKR